MNKYRDYDKEERELTEELNHCMAHYQTMRDEALLRFLLLSEDPSVLEPATNAASSLKAANEARRRLEKLDLDRAHNY